MSKVGIIGRYDNTTSACVTESFTRGSFNTSSQSPDRRTFWCKKTLERVKEKFYWPCCREYVTLWCSTCSECSSRKGPVTRQKARLGKYVVGASLERVAINVTGPLVRSTKGNCYLLVVMDYFSKWPEAYALPNQEGKNSCYGYSK